jgi:hypothetical protein
MEEVAGGLVRLGSGVGVSGTDVWVGEGAAVRVGGVVGVALGFVCVPLGTGLVAWGASGVDRPPGTQADKQRPPITIMSKKGLTLI